MRLTKHLKLQVAFILIAVIVLCGNSHAQTRILPLGDSNTRGFNGETYRTTLRQRLTTEAALNVDYVGTGVNVAGVHGPGPDFNTPYTSAMIAALDSDLEHEGWGGLSYR